MDFILNLDPQSGMELIAKAVEKKAEERTWQLWVSIYPNMDKEHFINYEDFKIEVGQGILEGRTDTEILSMVEKIKAADQNRNKE